MRGVVLTVTYTADPAEVNTLKLSRTDAGRYVFEETDPAGPTITPVAAAPLPNTGCEADPSDAHRVSCDGTGIQRVSITLNDLNDELTVGDSASPQPLDRSAVQAEGGLGNDTLRGGSAAETFQGSPGDDVLVGNGGDDLLQGFDGADRMNGGEGTDEIVGSAGDDTLLGRAGDDGRLSGGDGHDVVDGGEGNDDVRGDAGPDTVIGGPGDDRLDVDPDLRVDAADGPDALDGGPGADTLGAGRPRVASPGGTPSGQDADTLKGGDGIDTADYSLRTQPLTIYLDGVADDGQAGEGDNVVPDVEHIFGGSDSDTLVGSDDPNHLDGRAGDDTLDGRGGGDTLEGGVNDPSSDSLVGGSGIDTMSGGPGDDSLIGGEDDDRMSGGGGADTLEGEAGNDVLEGAAGADTVDGGEGNDFLYGGAIEFLIGADGPDELIGGRGVDALFAGPGNDLLDGGLGPDDMSGGLGKDTVTYEGRSSQVIVTLDDQYDDGEVGEDDRVRNDVEVVLGGRLGDSLVGNIGDDTIDGGPGEDLIVGNFGVDQLFGGDAPDLVRARDGRKDEVVCGDGGDLAIVDREDKVIECETVDRLKERRPEAGRYALVRPRGRFRLRLPQGSRFFPLAEDVKIRIESTIDATEGRDLRLVTASNRSRGRQEAVVSGGIFRLRQDAGRRPVTELRLAGDPPVCGASSAGARSAAAVVRRALRVDARKRGGRWQVRGRNSVGGSFGTTWSTEDRCDGTLTRVSKGTVRVRDLGRHRSVEVKAGDRYLARRVK